MNSRRLIIGSVVAMYSFALSPVSFAACDERSGPKTAALVELYTSEGCSSCPPADQQLRRLNQLLDPAAQVVPLALHVSYWDYIGWRDPYAQTAFGKRQSWLVHANQRSTVYTPQFFVSGTELRSWQGAMQGTVRQLNTMPAKAEIHVKASLAPNGALMVNAEAKARTGADPAALYLALAESGLVSSVTRGENSGTTLTHDHVVRDWIGPFPLADGAVKVQRAFSLPAAWSRARLEVVAFVQHDDSGRVLQALSALHCALS